MRRGMKSVPVDLFGRHQRRANVENRFDLPPPLLPAHTKHDKI